MMGRAIRLKTVWILVGLLVLPLLLSCQRDTEKPKSPATSAESVRTFQGAWFKISYPADYSVKPSLPSSTADGYDSAEFVAADGTVAFYVFAPQWGGEATDIALDPKRERLVDERVSQEKHRSLRWFTIAATDGSYRRSYLETVAQQGSVMTIVGIRYRDEEARQRHQEEYLQFRQSLELYAD